MRIKIRSNCMPFHHFGVTVSIYRSWKRRIDKTWRHYSISLIFPVGIVMHRQRYIYTQRLRFGFAVNQSGRAYLYLGLLYLDCDIGRSSNHSVRYYKIPFIEFAY